MEPTLLSFDLRADMGTLRKPDINEKYLTYNMLHRPALLGALGAILGLGGYRANGVLPEYYQRLKHLSVGIEPLSGDGQGHFQKTMITFNNGTGFASGEDGGNLIVTEQALIGPAYRCYLLLDESNPESDEAKLAKAIREQRAEYVPYLGKNEYPLWWAKESVKEYAYAPFEPSGPFRVGSLFVKTGAVRDSRQDEEKSEDFFDFLDGLGADEGDFFYFERLPYDFDEHLLQYRQCSYAYTNVKLADGFVASGLLAVQEKHKADAEEKVVQLQ